MLNGNATLHAIARAEFEKRGDEIKEALGNYIIPDDKIDKVVHFCIQTLVKKKNMKSARIVRRAAEEFKLKKRIETN